MASKQPSVMTVAAIGSIPLIMTLGNSMLIPVLPKMQSELHLTSFQAS
ncbi:major facilitator superfamily MFS_1 [Heyndrickxia coagulans 2-6]|nr:major facilitator superfamily MFS_1 [Heyndrickxia coagulans 2-6]